MAAAANYATVVQQLYVAYFGRPADVTGLQNFEAALAAADAPTTLVGLAADYDTNPAIASLINAFGNSGESGNLYGTNIVNSHTGAQQFVIAVFESLFNRAPLTSGLDFWTSAITSGSLTPGAAALEIALGAGTADAATLTTKVAAATAFTADLGENGAAVYQGANAAADGRAYLALVNSSTNVANYGADATEVVNSLVPAPVAPTPTPTPTPTPAPVTTMALTVSGDTITLDHTTASSSVSLSGADLTAFPMSTHGTVAELVTAGITSVTDSGGNFTLNAQNNTSATTFNFGTGVVSGSDPASSAGIAYHGVTTYVSSQNSADTVILSAANQNVTDSTGGITVNLVGLGGTAYTGTLSFADSGSGGNDAIDIANGANLAGAHITGGGASNQISLVVSAAGLLTLSTAEYNLITDSAAGRGITFTGSTTAENTIAFSDNAQTVTDNVAAGNYVLDSAGSTTIDLTRVASNVTDHGTAGNDTISLGNLAFTGTLAFGSGGSDNIDVTVGHNISAGTFNSSDGTAALTLVLSGSGSETMSTEEFNQLHAISGGSADSNTVIFSDAGSIQTLAGADNYLMLATGTTVHVNSGAAAGSITSTAASGNTFDFGSLTYTGTINIGSSGSDTVTASGGDISGAGIATAGAGLTFVFTSAGTETMSTAQYNFFSSISGGTAASNTIVFSDDVYPVAGQADVDNYTLSSAGGTTFSLSGANQSVTDSGTAGGDTINMAALAFAGTLTFGSGGSDNIVNVTVGGNISAGTIVDGEDTLLTLALSGAGSETVSTDEFNHLSAISGGSAAGNTIVFSDVGAVYALSGANNYTLSSSGGSTIHLYGGVDNVISSAGSDVVYLGSLGYTGTLAFTATSGSDIDTVNIAPGSDISSGAITTAGATVDLVLSSSGMETMTTAEYNAVTISGGSAASNTIVFSDSTHAVTASAGADLYTLSSAGGTSFTLSSTADQVTDSGTTGGDSFYLGSLTGGTISGGGGTDHIHATVGNDISDVTIGGGAAFDLTVTGTGTETISSTEFALFDVTGISFSAASSTNTLIVNLPANSSPTIPDADFAHVGNVGVLQIGAIGVGTGTGDQTITLGSDFSAAGVNTLTTSSSTGTIDIDASATTTALTINATSTGAGGNITISGGTGHDTINATLTTGSTLNITSSAHDTINVTSGAGTVNITGNSVDTIDLGAGHTSGNDTVTLSEPAIGTTITHWMSLDVLDLSSFLLGGGASANTVGSQSPGAETIVAFTPGLAVSAGDGVYDMGATTFASASALQTYLNNASTDLTFSSGISPSSAGAVLLFEYEDTTGNAHLAGVEVPVGAVDTTGAVVLNLVEFVGLSSTAGLQHIHLVA